MSFAIAIHGGAGTITRASMSREQEKAHIDALHDALAAGYDILHKGGSALDAVEAAVVALEDCPLFNAGRGSVFNSKGWHEMDASIMSGKELSAGAVTMVKSVKNPISLARAVMEKSEHVFLGGAGAEEFARNMNLPVETEDYFFNQQRYNQWKAVQAESGAYLDHNLRTFPVGDHLTTEKKFGTVGAVALDMHGNLAAGTSTGGMTNKKYSRIGDSPVIGAGTYANNNTCAVSCTGHGELFIRAVAAYDVSCLMEYKGLSLYDACNEVVMKKLVHLHGEGGLIAIDKSGNIQFSFNSEGMYRAMRKAGEEEVIAIYR
jgi:beta-aspartyl-peptidase (threonine type)